MRYHADQLVLIFTYLTVPLLVTIWLFLSYWYDNVGSVIEMTRDLITGLLDIYLSSMSNKMNEIMKVLTIISTIFIPLTFLSGLYGMNFKFMPELNYKYGYQITLFIMFLIFSGMLIYFKRRKWLWKIFYKLNWLNYLKKFDIIS